MLALSSTVVNVLYRSESRKGGAVYNIDLMFEKWLPDASSGLTELVCVFAGCALLLFDLALVAVFCPRAGTLADGHALLYRTQLHPSSSVSAVLLQLAGVVTDVDRLKILRSHRRDHGPTGMDGAAWHTI
jgi:hypothetical protein|eukprot:COSAG01_NODE_24781_length_766_cov_5.011994_1_plen_130_part_00